MLSPDEQLPAIESKQFWISLSNQAKSLNDALVAGGLTLEGWLKFLVNDVPVRVQYLENNDVLMQVGSMDDKEETWRYEVRMPKVWVTT